MCMEYEDKIIVDDFCGRKENSIWSHWWDWRSEKMDFFLMNSEMVHAVD